MKRIIFYFCLLVPFLVKAQDVTDYEVLKARLDRLEKKTTFMEKFVFSGFLQLQYELGQKEASLNVGNPQNEHLDDAFSRFGIRRGRLRLTYNEKLFTLVYHIDVTEHSIGIRDVFVDMFDPWYRTNSLRVGVFFRPFGHEIAFPSSIRESPERATIFRTLFPGDRDMGAMLTLQAPKSSFLSIFRFEAAYIAGNGINWETDSRRDFIGHLTASSDSREMSWRLGVSTYLGSVYQGTEDVYSVVENNFILNRSRNNLESYAKRQYFGIEGEFSYLTPIGKTLIRAEYLWGQQPGQFNSTVSPNSSSLPNWDTFIRDFNGGYVYLVQPIINTPIQAVVKFDWYNPNTKLKGNDIGRVNGVRTGSSADLWVNSLGFGLQWSFSSSFNILGYYEFKNNERTIHISGFEENRADNLFTARLQYRF